MNVNGFQVEEHGSGYAVTLRINVGREEALGEHIASEILGRIKAILGSADEPEKGTPREEQETEVVVAAGASSTFRHRRSVGSREPEKKDENPTQTAASSSTASPAGRRGRATQKPAPAAEVKSPSKSKITDEDLTKAASEAARTLGVAKVVKVLDEFGVSKVNQLEGNLRQEFLNKLNELTQ